MNGRIAWRLTVVLLAVVASGCASMERSATPLPPAKTLQAADMASLAGEWQGTLRGVGGRGPAQGRTANARVTVAPDGSFTTNIDGRPGAGTSRIMGGNIVFEGSTTRGTATLHEGGGRRVLVGRGTLVGFDGESAFELTPR